MAKYNLGQAYKELPTWAKGVIFVGGAVVLVALGLTVKNMIKKAKGGKDTKSFKDDASKLEAQGMKASYSDSQYQAFANQIYESVRYAVGDDYPKVVQIMTSMNNDLDVAKLTMAYGKRQRYNFGIPVGDELDLFSTITTELGNEFGGLYSGKVKQINENWSKKGITYKI